MRIHHLNCGTLRPLGRRRINGDGPLLAAGRLVCHCLLIATERRLVLVDTGFGLDDIEERSAPLLRSFLLPMAQPQAPERGVLHPVRQAYTRLALRAQLDPQETAARQLKALGYSAGDVTDIVLTHLDLDHTGGLRDFPQAKVHVSRRELQAANSPSNGRARFRYWSHHWRHQPAWITYGDEGGERWFGFGGARQLEGLPEITLVPLPGHTHGHCGVAVRLRDEAPAGGESWLLHAGDAYLFRGEIDPQGPRTPPALAQFQAQFQVDGAARRGNRHRLRELAAAPRQEIQIFCSHDPVELERLQSRTRAGAHGAASAAAASRVSAAAPPDNPDP